jgi:hypothetical protein
VGFENELIRQSNSPARPSPRRLGSRAWLIVIFTAGFPKGLKIPRFVSRVNFVPGPAASGPEYAVNAPLCARRKAALTALGH